MRVYKFVSWDIKPPMSDYTYEKFIQNYERGCTASISALNYGYIKIGGWCYDFKDELNRYLYKNNYGEWHEVYAPNKTAIRNSVYGRVLKIVKL